MDHSTPYEAAVVITTRNRCDDLSRALHSCVSQTDVQLEILVYDDESTDGTSEMVASEFPNVRLFRQDRRVGYIVLRNRGFHDTTAAVVFSLDDDARFTDPTTIRQTIDYLHTNTMIGAVALQYVEPHRTPKQGYMPETPGGTQVRNYIGCAHAIRVDVARQLGGYREFLVHQGEERDLCLRMLEAGYAVRYLPTPPIIHEPSQVRDHSNINYYGYRNTFLFDILNVPFPDILWRLPTDIVLLSKYRITLKTLPSRLLNTVRSLFACLWFLGKRAPVSISTYDHYRKLVAHGPIDPKTLSRTENLENRGYRQGG